MVKVPTLSSNMKMEHIVCSVFLKLNRAGEFIHRPPQSLCYQRRKISKSILMKKIPAWIRSPQAAQVDKAGTRRCQPYERRKDQQGWTTEAVSMGWTIKDDKAQRKKREKAMKVRRARTYDLYQQEAQAEYDESRESAIRTGERSERIRTHNSPQNRVTDHRIGLTIQKLDQIIDGNLDEVIEALAIEEQTSKLAALSNETI